MAIFIMSDEAQIYMIIEYGYAKMMASSVPL